MKQYGSGRSTGASVAELGLAASNLATRARPVLVINPRRDQVFAAAAEVLLDEGERSLPSFQEALRRRFSDTVVRARDLSGEANTVWYLFRDGRWVNGRDDSEPTING